MLLHQLLLTVSPKGLAGVILHDWSGSFNFFLFDIINDIRYSRIRVHRWRDRSGRIQRVMFGACVIHMLNSFQRGCNLPMRESSRDSSKLNTMI
jgi:hypothetical protein